MTEALTSIELFTGAGGLALGVASAGFSHRLLLEYNADACSTLRLNRSAFGQHCEIHEGDVHNFNFAGLGNVDLLAAGAPCQPFSIGGKHRAHADERNLFPEVFRAVRELSPKAVLIENVKGLLRPSLGDFVEYVELQLAYPDVIAKRVHATEWFEQLVQLRTIDKQRRRSSSEYRVHKLLLNAADFGVPQKRERVFFIALRRDVEELWIPPRSTHSLSALKIAKEVTGDYWREHGLKRKVRQGHPSYGKWAREAGRTKAWSTVRDAISGLPEPVPREEHPDVRNHVGQPGARPYPGHTGSPLDWPAKTLKAGVHGVPGGENMLLRQNGTVRYFTVREAARLQSFPDDYVFTGAWGEAMRQIGNAVPVVLAAVVASSIRQCLAQPPSIDPQKHEQRFGFVQGVFPGLS